MVKKLQHNGEKKTKKRPKKTKKEKKTRKRDDKMVIKWRKKMAIQNGEKSGRSIRR